MIKKFFNWLSGKKTVIGFALTWSAQIPGIDPSISEILLYAGGIIGGTGMIHKAAKSMKRTD